MTLADLLLSPTASLPKPARRVPFRRALREALAAYRAEVDRLDPADPASADVLAARDVIDAAGAAVVAVVDAHVRGQAGRARDELVAVVDVLRPQLELLLPMPGSHAAVPEDASRQPREVLFRMRVGEPYDEFDRAGIFHVPFHLRHRVATARYSVSGLPMLYLGASLYACWVEIGRPPLDRVWMSAFRFRAPVPPKILNFGLPPELFGAMLSVRRDFGPRAAAYATAWPLIAACAFRAKERGAAFVEEYVVPQTLMSWVAERGEYAGVRYFSTHVGALGAGLAGTNVVLPARDAGDDGHCGGLAGLLELTAPVSWAHTAAVGDRRPAYAHPTQASLRNGEGPPVPYDQSQFFLMEARLMTYPFAPLGGAAPAPQAAVGA